MLLTLNEDEQPCQKINQEGQYCYLTPQGWVYDLDLALALGFKENGCVLDQRLATSKMHLSSEAAI